MDRETDREFWEEFSDRVAAGVEGTWPLWFALVACLAAVLVFGAAVVRAL